MQHASLFIAVDLVQDTDAEHRVVDYQEEERPLDKRPIESFEPFLNKSGLVVKIACGEEIAGGDEEQGHVELEDELTEPSGRLSMPYDHQDDGNALRYRNRRIPIHYSLFTFTAKAVGDCRTSHGTSASLYGTGSILLRSGRHSSACRGRTYHPVPWSFRD